MCIIFITVAILNFHLTASENVHMTKVFILPIEPEIFNWTEKGNDQYSYQPSLHSAPDLPSWMHYTYSKRHHIGLLYGVPPINHGDVKLEIVGLDHKSYETRQRTIQINVHKKEDPAKYEVQLKIHNLNVEDMFDSRRLDRLLNVFRKKLWPESDEDLYVTFLASAIQLGGRLPLRPSEEEGIVMRIGSTAPFSSLLIELQEEVRPLWKRGSCPRDFKRTTVEWLFRDAGLALDWCAFRLIEDSASSGLTHSSHQDSEFPRGQGLPRLAQEDRWSRPAKTEVPRRSYVGEFVFTIVVPMMVMVLLVLLLSFILCFHREGITNDGSSDFFESVFDIFEAALSKRDQEVPETQMVQYTAVQRASHTLRSLSSQRQVLGATPSDQYSMSVSRSRTGSPNSSLARSASPRLMMEHRSYYRPDPPPYIGPTRSIGNHADF